ncbi:50S ribosomal protein L11 methyltransferase [Prosthecodimorpha staleyi]|uniref:Ribosomal protein L11 methyltransferase n=1 Tax=Prosthecodimorpha staleyi TaxID=2840188 RepID=A0A947DAA7_9HYPH|nr:50S ribosomal protein L11 methyltransferase [Prosthecodimorpha staleyi]MBT9291397.1 50S ribosomal protein L11 methyltransferase [Prosthecodimorpha staleyi]
MPTVQVRLTAGFEEARRIADLLEDAFELEGFPVTLEETPAYSNVWTVFALVLDSEPGEAIERVIDVLGADAFGLEPQASVLDEATNWVALSEEIRHPVQAGRFFVHGSHDRVRRPPTGQSIEIDAELAFGTGHHATTWACLAALDLLFKKERFARPLDLGTGTGLLAIAIARVLRVKVLATDIDPVAVAIARGNVRLNGVGGLVECLVADGMRARRLMEQAPYDLVVANILARPLMRLAAPVARTLAPRAAVVLSGLRTSDAPKVLAAWRMQGLHLDDAIERDDWMALILRNSRA